MNNRRHSLTFREETWDALRAIIFSEPGVEGAAYVRCGVSQTDSELRFLARGVMPVAPEHYLVRDTDRLSIDALSYVRAAKAADAAGEALVFVHSHPMWFPHFSEQDDREDPKLHVFFADRAPKTRHGSLVVTRRTGRPAGTSVDASPVEILGVAGRVWVDGDWEPLGTVRVIGRRYQFFGASGEPETDFPPFFDRQVRAFGPDVQRALSRLHIGVVGAGGTGSAVIEQLTRLGVGQLTVFDGDSFDPTNVNRVYSSAVEDAGRPKVDIASDAARATGLGVRLRPVAGYIDSLEIAKQLRDCDVVFGCTDDMTSRAILGRLALSYFIPVIDMGVVINAPKTVIEDVVGRVTTVAPGLACLVCRGQVTAEGLRLEALSSDERDRQVREGYAPALATRAPAVIAFTSAVAAQAVAELLHRLTGFGGPTTPSEILMLFDQRRVSTNTLLPNPDCQCVREERWGVGDERRFLDRAW